MKNKLTKLISLFLSLLILFSSITAFADTKYDGGTTPTFDETLYEILDYYGNRESSSVVKRVQLNGNKSFVDYGSYASVNDMSGRAEATISGDSVRFDIEDDYNKNEMFFEAVPKNDAIEMPWSFEVSYKLNGVPKKAEDLAGTSGTIEINAHCIPNPKIDEYSKNNLLLQVAAIVDTQKVLSVEAPGAQQQEVGKYKVILFTALPSEDITFTIRIGTDSFSLIGLLMLIEPGTLSQLEQIKNLREQLDAFGDAPTLLLGGMSDLLSSVQTISGGVNELNNSLGEFQSVYNEATKYVGDIKSESENVLMQFSSLSKSLSNIVNSLNGISSSINDITKKLEQVSDSISADDIASTIDQTSQSVKELKKNLEDIQAEYDKLLITIDNLEEQAKTLPNSDNIVALLDSLKSLVSSSNNSIKTAIELVSELDKVLDTIKNDVLPNSSSTSNDIKKLVESALGYIDKAVTELNNVSSTISQSIISITSIYSAITNAISDSQTDFNKSVQSALNGVNTISNGCGDLSNASGQLKDVSSSLQTTIDTAISEQTSSSNIIDIDPNASIRSFTSEKNATPTSTQIVLRTHSIGLTLSNDDDDIEIETPQTPLDRIKLLFKRIANAFKALFA